MNGNDLLAQIENENPKLGIYLRNYLIPTIQPRGRAGQVLATPPDAVGNASLRNLSDLVNSSNPPSASYVGTDKSGGIVVAPTPAAGITALTGDVDASGSGSVSATVKGVNGASVPLSEAYLGTNGSGQIIPASAPSSGITELTGDVTAGPGSGSQAATVVGIRGVGVSGTAPTDGQGLVFDATSGLWVPSALMTNPMTTVGDLIVGGTVSGGVAAPARLAAGTAGQVLTSNGPGVAPSYQASGGGGSSFPFTVVQELQATNGNTAATSYTLAFPKATAASGNTAFILIATDDTTSAITLPTGWTVDFNQPQASFARLILIHKATAGETSVTFTWSSGSGGGAFYFFELGGVRSFDQVSAGGSANVSYLAMPSITPSAGALVFCAGGFACSGPASFVPQVMAPYKAFLIESAPSNQGRSVFGYFAEAGASNVATTPPGLNFSSIPIFGGSGIAYASFSIK